MAEAVAADVAEAVAEAVAADVAEAVAADVAGAVAAFGGDLPERSRRDEWMLRGGQVPTGRAMW